MNVAEAELSFTQVRAPFDGIVDRIQQQKGSLVKKEEILTTLYDNSVMWVYFNVPEAWYLNYKTGKGHEDPVIELVLANGSKFAHTGVIGAITAKFNNEVGTIPFRTDFPNSEGLLRHGQTGNVLIHRTLKNSIVIPQRATFEILNKQYVYLVGKDNVVHQHEIVAEPYGLDDVFVIKTGLEPNDRFVLDGVRQVKDGDKVEFEFRKPEEALDNQKNHAE
jgi:membrane fusion protein (multidrug efflux system)